MDKKVDAPDTTKPSYFYEGFVLYGAGTRNRTRDLLITREMLSTVKTMSYVVSCYVAHEGLPLNNWCPVALLRLAKSGGRSGHSVSMALSRIHKRLEFHRWRSRVSGASYILKNFKF